MNKLSMVIQFAHNHWKFSSNNLKGKDRLLKDFIFTFRIEVTGSDNETDEDSEASGDGAILNIIKKQAMQSQYKAK